MNTPSFITRFSALKKCVEKSLIDVNKIEKRALTVE